VKQVKPKPAECSERPQDERTKGPELADFQPAITGIFLPETQEPESAPIKLLVHA
jgi:hypothetical protein